MGGFEWLGPPEPPPSFSQHQPSSAPGRQQPYVGRGAVCVAPQAPGAWPSWACHSRFFLPEWQAGQRVGAAEPLHGSSLSLMALNRDLTQGLDPGAGPQYIPARPTFCGPIQIRLGP